MAVRRGKTLIVSVGLFAVALGLSALTTSQAAAGTTPARAAGQARLAHSAIKSQLDGSTPIQHVVVIFQENHSFDNVLGKLCVEDARCDGSTTGKLKDGTTVPLQQATDIIPNVAHSTSGQNTAIDNGKMDGWQAISGCSKQLNYRCLSQFDGSQIPNLWALARQFAISDRTFETDRILSFGAHVELASANLDGFSGEIPNRPSYARKSGPGWGCQSYKVTPWRPSPTAAYQDVPPCVPFPDGTGSWWDDYGPNGTPALSPVRHIGNVFDALDAAHKTWKVYNAIKAFDICSYFATCAHSVQSRNVVPSKSVITDAQAGSLPNVSYVLPDNNKTTGSADQHNLHSMAVGDNWIGNVVSAIEHGPDWASTAVFITYDDCGCFYDHVPPPNAKLGIRLPMVIVSPYAKPGYTDSNVVGFVGMLAFVEHNFGLPALAADDAASYDYSDSFDLSRPGRLTRTRLVTTPISKSELAKNRKKVLDPDDADDAT